MRDRDRYLKQRGNRYHYIRRVPTYVSKVDKRGIIRVTLKTDNIAVARKKRDQLEEADDLFWSALIVGNKEAALKRYQAAVERATLNGFTYLTADELAEQVPVSELLERVEAVPHVKDVATLEAVLGGVTRPKVSLMDSFELYVSEIAASEVASKSPSQRASWKKVKLRAVNNFIRVVGDIPLEDITRDQARKFYKWWLDRIVPPEGSKIKPLSPYSGNRDVGNMRKLFTEYFTHLGEEDRPNPFRKMSFSIKQGIERASFSNDWLTGKIMKPGMLDGLNMDARLIVYMSGPVCL